MAVYSQPQSHDRGKGIRRLNPCPIKEIFMCLLQQLILILREVACAQYLTETACGGKVP